MKCWKCTNPAVVHLTDIVSQSDGSKQAMEVHLCMAHAVEAGLVANPGKAANPEPVEKPAKAPTTIHPTASNPGPSSVTA